MIDSPAERKAAELQELLSRLKWAYPARDPVEHMRSPAWVEDLVAWSWLGTKRRR